MIATSLIDKKEHWLGWLTTINRPECYLRSVEFAEKQVHIAG